jgi:hypothetical protein
MMSMNDGGANRCATACGSRSQGIICTRPDPWRNDLPRRCVPAYKEESLLFLLCVHLPWRGRVTFCVGITEAIVLGNSDKFYALNNLTFGPELGSLVCNRHIASDRQVSPL